MDGLEEPCGLDGLEELCGLEGLEGPCGLDGLEGPCGLEGLWEDTVFFGCCFTMAAVLVVMSESDEFSFGMVSTYLSDLSLLPDSDTPEKRWV